MADRRLYEQAAAKAAASGVMTSGRLTRAVERLGSPGEVGELGPGLYGPSGGVGGGPPVMSALRELGDDLARLEEVVGELRARLSGVLAPPSPSPTETADGLEKGRALSPLTLQLGEFRLVTSRVKCELLSMMDRLEL